MQATAESHVDARTQETFHLPFRSAVVLGAGTMGAQIAAHLANAGLDVHLLDITPSDGGSDRNAVVEKGFEQARKMKPDPFFTKETAHRVTLGNFDDDFGRVGEVDWVIEAVVERMDVKRSVMERIEQAARADAIISTNTSGLPIAEIAAGRSEGFRRRFLGTHFFNPPRYLKLLELVPSEDTDVEVVERMAWFGRVHLGKGIVVAKDTPYFIGNRIGIYAMSVAMRRFTDGGYTIEEIDRLTGTLVGRAKSGTFRTADVVGLDVMAHVAKNLYEAVPEDESRELFVLPDLVGHLVEKGALGQKTGAGFYRKEGRDILSIDPHTGDYTPAAPMELGDLERIERAGDLPARLRVLFEDEGRAGTFFRETTLDVLGYSARRIPEITERPADIDRALRWGFGWELGPFEIWDALGFETVLEAMREADISVPAWVLAMEADGRAGFYRVDDAGRSVYIPADDAYRPDPRPADEIPLASIAAKERRMLWQNEEAALLDLGDGVAVFVFRSKANTLGRRVMQGLVEAIDRVEDDPSLRGLVVGNEGKNFSVGANLGEAGAVLQQGGVREIEGFVAGFQEAVQRVRYARKPVVVAVHQRVLGGACELVLACPHPVAAAESYIGLVELGVGLIPAGTGTTRLAALAAERAPNGHPSEIQAWIQRFFENVAMAKVATSAREAQAMGYLPRHARIVMHADRRLYAAKEEVLRLSNQGYLPPVQAHVKVLGTPTRAAIEVMLQQYREGDFISDYDLHLGRQLAYVITGGDLTAPQEVHEEYLLELEREVILGLLREPKTQERVQHMLATGKPLRN